MDFVSKGVYGSIWVGFVPNSESIHSHRVGGWTTCCWLRTTLGQVGSVSDEQRSCRSKSEWVSTSRSLLNHRQISLNLRWIFAGSVDFSLDLCDNHGIEAKNTTSSLDLSENFHLITRSSLDLCRICWFFFEYVWQPQDWSTNHHLKPKFEWKHPSHRQI